jgi:hypothetical protein
MSGGEEVGADVPHVRTELEVFIPDFGRRGTVPAVLCSPPPTEAAGKTVQSTCMYCTGWWYNPPPLPLPPRPAILVHAVRQHRPL